MDSVDPWLTIPLLETAGALWGCNQATIADIYNVQPQPDIQTGDQRHLQIRSPTETVLGEKICPFPIVLFGRRWT